MRGPHGRPGPWLLVTVPSELSQLGHTRHTEHQKANIHPGSQPWHSCPPIPTQLTASCTGPLQPLGLALSPIYTGMHSHTRSLLHSSARPPLSNMPGGQESCSTALCQQGPCRALSIYPPGTSFPNPRTRQAEPARTPHRIPCFTHYLSSN